MIQLPIYNGWTVDLRLKQFRRILPDGIEFVDFDSAHGDVLLFNYLNSLPDNEAELIAREVF